MKTLKKMLKPIQNGYAPTERFSLRVQNGVEIYEHEALHTCKIPKEAGSLSRAPRLVIAKPGHTQSSVIIKTRDEITGLTALLRILTAAR